MKTMFIKLFIEKKTTLAKVYKKTSKIIKAIYKKRTSFILSIRKQIQVWLAQCWQYYYSIKAVLVVIGLRYKTVVTVLVLVGLFVLSWISYSDLKTNLEPYFYELDRFNRFQTFLLTLGGALIGATAIAFSLIMFAMQVNVERMPHGLFRKFSSDLKLLMSFAITFILAITITALSLVPDESWVTVAGLGTVWCTVLIVLFLLVAYRRALDLISPTKQLSILIADTKKNLKIWSNAARRTAPLLKPVEIDNAGEQERHSDHDMERIIYFQLNPSWTTVAQREINHCVSFARRYAEQGDHEVSGYALNAIIAINAAYITAKGKTFFCNNYLIDNPLASDGFIINTLEHMRQNVQIGISRGDEQQIEQTFRALVGLCQLYSNIDYASDYATKSHSHLAAGYLASSVESIVPHNMADVLMEGIRLLGTSAQQIIANKESDQIATISEKIALIACTGTVYKNYQPVTQAAVMQLAKLTFELIRSKLNDVRFALGEVQSDIKLIAEMYLKIPDSPFTRIHSTSLAPYYSGTSNDTLMSWLTELTNAISNAQEEDETAQRIIYHIKQWSEELCQSEKDLFLLSIEKKSGFAFDIIHWIVHITKLLLAVSNANACSEHNRDGLRRNALWLISVLDWVPDNKEAISFVENYQMTESLFEAATDAKRRGCDDIALTIRDMLMSWAFKAGKYQTGWAILERACYGLACLTIIFELDDIFLINAIQEKVGREGSPSFELRYRASQEIREEADNYHDGHVFRAIELAMAHVDQGRLRTLLIEIANKLVPEVIEVQEDRL